MRREILSWSDVDKLVDYLIPQIHGRFDSMVIITRGGIVPGGMLAEALDITYVLTAAVRFPADYTGLGGIHPEQRFAVPEFLQFPDDDLLVDRRVLVVDDVWTRGRNIVTVAGRIDAAGGMPETCVLHYKPALSLYPGHTPTYYAAVTDAFIVYPWEIDRDIEATSVWN
ncbi:MAG: phosphoribosyltransferase [Anaerolineae bacterium]|nr:phosphoribosyltransferase [Anaerolineae bacterium]MCO5191844.1 phosphoribosyltransferase [Anaerolineae bacterium]MCO5199666.1 phosphoribosyltransferase [Anaerolineae bacterium]MCO5207464.1 phosphoribosyltransferase [Anaerolineae bacterium]